MVGKKTRARAHRIDQASSKWRPGVKLGGKLRLGLRPGSRPGLRPGLRPVLGAGQPTSQCRGSGWYLSKEALSDARIERGNKLSMKADKAKVIENFYVVLKLIEFDLNKVFQSQKLLLDPFLLIFHSNHRGFMAV